MTDHIRDILRDLERVRENMLALSDDIWLSIDHNDQEALKAGVEFKLLYNEKMTSFDRLSTEISELVQHFTQIQIQEIPNEKTDKPGNDRIIKELNKEEPHGLKEDFTYKRPHGFILCGHGVKGIATWRQLFEHACGILLKQDPKRFLALPGNKTFKTNRGNSNFATQPDQLRVGTKLADAVYAEVNLSANGLCKVIRDMLKVYGIPETEMIVFLRQDRDAS